MIKKNGGIFGRNPTYNDVVVEGVLTLKEAQVFDNDITINGDLTVNGTETVINTVELNVDDKNITMGAVVAKVGLAATTNITAGQFTVQLADTSGLIPGMTVTKTAGTGAFGASPKIASVDSRTQITLTVSHATSGTIIFDTGGATDDTADGGGITLKGTTDKFIKWVKASVAWVFSDPIKAPDVIVDNLTASKPVFTDANKKLTSTGTLAIDQGGTGQTTQQAAINALAGAVTAAQFLRGDGTNVSMSAIQASDVPTLNQSTTGSAGSVKSNATTGVLQVAGPTAGTTRVMTTPDANFIAARTDAAQTFTGAQTFSNIKIDANSISSVNTNGDINLAPNGSGNIGLTADRVQYYGKALKSVTSGGSTSHMLSYQTWESEANVLVLGNTFGPIVFGTGGGTMTGKVKISTDGNVVIGTSGKGIDFSATAQAGGMTSELLNDYEEGTWTPVVSSSSGTITSYGKEGSYVKIGRMVTVTCYIAITDNGTGASYLNVAGLPFTVAAQGASTAVRSASVLGTTNVVQVPNAGTTFTIWKYDNTYPVATGSTLNFSFSYFV